mmetsp:Transcript_3560/g.7633  ORF Transcript_3560/g.7633 Transcript_3560/m.7633 type:complete len:168 (+) Transcript_3560:2619-3122(+)
MAKALKLEPRRSNTTSKPLFFEIVKNREVEDLKQIRLVSRSSHQRSFFARTKFTKSSPEIPRSSRNSRLMLQSVSMKLSKDQTRNLTPALMTEADVTRMNTDTSARQLGDSLVKLSHSNDNLNCHNRFMPKLNLRLKRITRLKIAKVCSSKLSLQGTRPLVFKVKAL